jgi:hypothetical protein
MKKANDIFFNLCNLLLPALPQGIASGLLFVVYMAWMTRTMRRVINA